MLEKNFTIPSDQLTRTMESYLASSWNILTRKVSKLANLVFSSVYAVYDFPRSTNPVTQRREFRFYPVCLEKFYGTLAYPTLLKERGRVVRESDTVFGNYSRLVHEIGRELIVKCPRKDLFYEFEVVENSQDNACCLPGGKIAINLGLIRNLEEEKSTFGMNRSFTIQEKIAAVLSHEITHAAARHGGRTLEFKFLLYSIFKVMELSINFFIIKYFNNEIKKLEKIEVKTSEKRQEIIKLKRNRDLVLDIVFEIFDFFAYQWILTHCILCSKRSHEFEADKYGMHLVHKLGSECNKLGFNRGSAEAAVWLQHYFKEVDSREFTGWLGRILKLLSTHPSPKERLAANQKTWEELRIA